MSEQECDQMRALGDEELARRDEPPLMCFKHYKFIEDARLRAIIPCNPLQPKALKISPYL